MGGWVDLGVTHQASKHLIATRPGVEPTTSRSQGRHPTVSPPRHLGEWWIQSVKLWSRKSACRRRWSRYASSGRSPTPSPVAPAWRHRPRGHVTAGGGASGHVTTSRARRRAGEWLWRSAGWIEGCRRRWRRFSVEPVCTDERLTATGVPTELPLPHLHAETPVKLQPGAYIPIPIPIK